MGRCRVLLSARGLPVSSASRRRIRAGARACWCACMQAPSPNHLSFSGQRTKKHHHNNHHKEEQTG
jgi:hypothetical protein